MDAINEFMFLNDINNQSNLSLRDIVDLKNLIEDLNAYLDNNFDVYFIGRILYI